MKEKYVVENYNICYCYKDGSKTTIETCSREENAQKICDILNADRVNIQFESKRYDYF